MRIGIIGASPDRGWASTAHIPAIAALPELKLVAVSTSREESARRAAETFGVPHTFADPRRLAELPDVDLVAITVKVAAHAELARIAIEAGKHVYCEWPLALDLTEATELERLARRAGVRTVVGLQARYSPGFAYARELIQTGYVGRVTSATLYGIRGKGAEVEVPAWSAYTYQRSSAAGLVDVLGGHSLDLIGHLLGPIASMTARTSIQHPHHVVAETGEQVEVTAPDHLNLIGELDSGADLSVHLHDGELAAPRTRLEISGTNGLLAVESVPTDDPWAAQLQITDLVVKGNDQVLPIPDRFRSEPAGLSLKAASVARLYQAFLAGDEDLPDFATGVRMHKLLGSIG